MPRLSFSPSEQHEQRWTSLSSWVAEALVHLRPGRPWHARARGGVGSWVIRLERRGPILEAALYARFRRALTPQQESAVLDLGWAPRKHEFVVMWQARHPVDERPVGLIEALVKGPRGSARDWLGAEERQDAAELLIGTITGPLEVIDADDVAWDVR